MGGWPITDYFTRSLSDPSTQCLVIARAEQMEALIALRIAAGESRLGRGASMLYVDYLLSGPDNLRPPVGRLELKALGPVLIAGAALLSDRLGFEGRLGLHSKPASETFYRRQGFTEVGPERTDDGVWVYFELSPEGATKLLRGGA